MARTPAPGTRERILTVASRLFYAHGVRAVGMNQIIAEAGTGKNLLYQHFPTKDDLVAAYLGRIGERRAASARHAREAAGDDPRAQLVAAVADVAATMGHPQARGCPFRNYLAEFPDAVDAAAEADVADAEPVTRADVGSSIASGASSCPAAVAAGYLAASRRDLAAVVARAGVDDPERLLEQLWLLVDGLYLQAAYRDHADGPGAERRLSPAPSSDGALRSERPASADRPAAPAAEVAVDLARRLVADA